MIEQFGWLYFNDSPVDVMKRIETAIERFKCKFGRKPDVCYVNPNHITGQLHVSGVIVKPRNTIIVNHFWLGVESDTIWTHCPECMTRTDHIRRNGQLVCAECEKRQSAQPNSTV